VGDIKEYIVSYKIRGGWIWYDEDP